MKPPQKKITRTDRFGPLQIAGLFFCVPLMAFGQVAPAESPAGSSAAKSDVLQLSPFEVSAKADRGYGSAQAAGATRIALPVSDVAGSVVTVNQELIKDIGGAGMQALGDVAKYVSGVTYSNDVGQGSVVVRGTYSRGGSLLEDGLPSSAISGSSAGIALIDMNVYDRVEVVKGPNGILYGAHALGGLLDRVTKKPLPVEQTNLSVWAGSYNTFGASLDSTGPLGKSDKLLYRLVLTEQQGEGPNGEDNNLRGITPQIEYRPSSDTTFRIAYSNVTGRVPRTAYTFGDPSGQPHLLWDATIVQQTPGEAYREGDFNQVTFTFNHTFDLFNERWNMNMVGRYTDTSTNWLLDQTIGAITAFDATGNSLGALGSIPAGTPTIASVRTANWFRRLFQGHDTRWITNLDVAGKFKLGPTEHLFFTGAQVTAGTAKDDRFSYTPTAPVGGYQMWPNPVFPTGLPSADDIAIPARRITPATVITNNPLLGWVAQDNMKLFKDHVLVVGGIRWDYGGGSTTKQIATGALSQAKTIDVWTPKYGVIFKPIKGVSAFYNYTQTYEVNTTIDTRLKSPTFGQLFPNRDGKMKEIGLKLELLENRVIATASTFNIELTNGLAGLNDDDLGTVTGLPRGAYSVPAGSLTTKGQEIDLAVTPIDSLQFMVGWSHLNALTEAGFRVGNGVPKETVSALARYSFSRGFVKGLSVGAGINSVAGRVLSNTDSRPIPDYTLTEAFVTYRHKQWELQLNVKNLTNETYIISPTQNFGWPRTYTARFRYSF